MWLLDSFVSFDYVLKFHRADYELDSTIINAYRLY